MPIYLFKCQKCGKDTEIIMTFKEIENAEGHYCVGRCNNKKCGTSLFKAHQQINFEGYVTMVSPVTKVGRKYSNKAGGPKPIIDGKIRNDLKMPTQV